MVTSEAEKVLSGGEKSMSSSPYSTDVIQSPFLRGVVIVFSRFSFEATVRR